MRVPLSVRFVKPKWNVLSLPHGTLNNVVPRVESSRVRSPAALAVAHRVRISDTAAAPKMETE